MTREDPHVPLALVWQLAQQTATRRGLTPGNYAHIVMTKGTSSTMTGTRIEGDSDFDVFMGRALDGVTRMDPDTATILFATQPKVPFTESEDVNGKRSDFGLILRPHQPPFGIVWYYDPAFQMTLMPEESMAEISRGVGVVEVQQLLDRTNPKI